MTADRSEVSATVAAFLADRPDGEAVLEAVLEVDADRETWTFDDVPLDSGAFGELVSRGIVESVDDGYRVASPEVVSAALGGEEIVDGDEREGVLERWAPELGVWGDRRALAGLVGALAVVFVMRILNFRSVFRGDHVVSPGNDPYHYRFWMETLLAESEGVTDVGVVAAMPEPAARMRPLTHATNWFVAELLGGDGWAADLVAAWLPVAASLVLGVLVFWLAVIVTEDVRVGLASVVLLALTPVHAVYTGVGFLEHRLHQYLWLGVTLVALSWLAADLQRRREGNSSTHKAILDRLRSPRTWFAALAFGVSLAFSAHAWGGSVLLFVPLATYVAFAVAMDVREAVPPATAAVPVLVGLAIASAMSAFLHVRWGWHEPFVAAVPALTFAGAVGVVALGELWRRTERSAVGLLALQGALAVTVLSAFRLVRPAEWTRLLERVDALLGRERYTEAASLFTLDLGIIFGPLAQLGVGFYVGLVVFGWAIWLVSRRYEPAWLVLSVYVGFWLVMATIQVRFAAQLAISMAVFGGLGFVQLLAWVDLARVPAPFRSEEASDRRGRPTSGNAAVNESESLTLVLPQDVHTAAYLVGIALLVCGMSLVFVPSLSAQTAYDDAQFEAAMAIDEHAERVDRSYPATYVLSHWPDNRMYNYFVNGESRSYAYADDTFEPFTFDDDPDRWYDRFEADSVGYVVLNDDAGGTSDASVQAQLHEHHGLGTGESDPLSHYQTLYVGDGVTVFAIVPGATIEGAVEANDRIAVETTVTVSDRTLTYARDVPTGEDGSFAVTVPYPGEYDVAGETMTVSEEEILEGRTIELE